MLREGRDYCTARFLVSCWFSECRIVTHLKLDHAHRAFLTTRHNSGVAYRDERWRMVVLGLLNRVEDESWTPPELASCPRLADPLIDVSGLVAEANKVSR